MQHNTKLKKKNTLNHPLDIKNVATNKNRNDENSNVNKKRDKLDKNNQVKKKDSIINNSNKNDKAKSNYFNKIFKSNAKEEVEYMEFSEFISLSFNNEEIIESNIYKGVVGFTNYRIFFIFDIPVNNYKYIYFPLLFVNYINKNEIKIGSSKYYCLEFILKIQLIMKINIIKNDNFFEKLIKLSLPYDIRNTYYYKCIHSNYSNSSEIKSEIISTNTCSPNKDSINDILKTIQNKGYYLCDSYPHELHFPKEFKFDSIDRLALLFVDYRFPIIINSNNIDYNSNKNTFIWLSSEYIGKNDSSNNLFTNYFEEIINNNKLFILVINDKQFDSLIPQNLKKNITASHCKLDNHFKISKFNYSKQKNKENNKMLENSWLEEISAILKFSSLISLNLSKSNNVWIYGSNGLDRNIQFSSISLILNNKNNRTILGFCDVIKNTWFRLGFPFSLRYSLYKQCEISPIFIQFLECLYQLLLQFPAEFEFNIELLDFLAYNATSGEYSFFLLDNEMERNKYKIRDNLFEYIANNRNEFINPFFDNDFCNNLNLFPNYSSYKMEIWKFSYYKSNITNYTTINSHTRNCLFLINKNQFDVENKRRSEEIIKLKQLITHVSKINN